MSLFGKRVLITRAAADAADLQRRVAEQGATSVALPTLVRAPPDNLDALAAAAAILHRADGVAIGSLSALRPLAQFVEAPCRCVVGCVGEKTADGLDADGDLAAKFRGPRVVPPVFRAESLVEALRSHFGGRLDGRVFVVPRAAEGRPALVDGLTAAGAVVHDVVAYHIRPAPPPAPKAWTQAQRVDVALFLSGETLANLLRIVPEDEARRLLARVVVGVIGPVAKARADALGIRVDVVPAEATQDALIEAVVRHLALSGAGRS